MVTAEEFANRRAALDAAARIYAGALATTGYDDVDRDNRPGLLAEEVIKCAVWFEKELNTPNPW
jgi:hypothetical protein